MLVRVKYGLLLNRGRLVRFVQSFDAEPGVRPFPAFDPAPCAHLKVRCCANPCPEMSGFGRKCQGPNHRNMQNKAIGASRFSGTRLPPPNKRESTKRTQSNPTKNLAVDSKMRKCRDLSRPRMTKRTQCRKPRFIAM